MDSDIDIDLSIEGPAWKISRLQGYIKLRPDGTFHVKNEGRRPVYIDGKAVTTGARLTLSDNCTFEVYYFHSTSYINFIVYVV